MGLTVPVLKRMSCEDLAEFLRGRGLVQVQKFFDDKIDCAALLEMDDFTLKTYIPAYGDRVTAIAFSKSKCGSSVRSTHALDEVKRKLDMQRSRSQFRQGNQCAIKTTRRLELGWMDYCSSTNTYKQIRQNYGGGVRHLSVEKVLTVDEIKTFAIDTFYPSGTSPKGDKHCFSFELRDFKGGKLDPQKSLSELYEDSKLKLLRLYLYTKRNEEGGQKEDGNRTCESAGCSTVREIQKCPVKSDVESNNIPAQEVTSNKPTPQSSDGDHMEAGTPTVLIKKSLFQGTDECDVEILDDELPDISLKKRRCLKLKTTCPDRREQDHSDSEEDTDLKAAIQASLEENGDTMKEILSKLSSQVDDDGNTNIINVDRYDILDGARRGFSRKKFKNQSKLNVKFSGEYGIDEGGPSREFMRLVLKAIRDSPIFEGDENAKILCPDMLSEERGDYYMFGKMIAYFIVHKGPSPSFFSALMYNMITGKAYRPQISDVTDAEIRVQLQMIKEAEDIRTLTLPDTILQAIDYVGGVPLLSQNKKDRLLEALLQFLVITRVKRVLSQFLDGLSCMGVLRAVREYPSTLSPLFTHQNSRITAAQIEELFQPVFSAEGSNHYIQELRTQSHWRDFLEDLDEKPGGVESLLQFVTGLDAAPALGFDPSPKLRFSHPDIENPHDGTPYANTCANSLTVPVVQCYEVFCERMNMALSFGTFFTNG